VSYHIFLEQNIKPLQSEPFLELIGDDENETLNETLIFESLSRGKCYFQRMERAYTCFT
jgi:hypothetical protein